jgi:hypothetical protein
MVKLTHILFAVLILLFVGGLARANDRDRRARAALALAATEVTPPAPGPRAVVLPGYAEAYRRALASDSPLVVYVGCAGRHPIERLPNAVVAAAGELEGFGPGTVVIGFPHNGKLIVHTALRCPEYGAPVAKAVEDARKRIAMPPGRAEVAPVPLNWDVRAGPCVCASSCACPRGVCPQRCPVVVK